MCSAILLMAGSSTRLPLHLPKPFLPLGQERIFERTLKTFEGSKLFDEIILVSAREWQVEGSIVGGETRQASSYQGLLACKSTTKFVVIHDAVRPFVSERILEAHLEKLQRYGAINTCIRTADTINCVVEGEVESIPDRKKMWRGQTPQSFHYSLIKEAHEKSRQIDAFDDCSLILEMGHSVHVVEGEEINFKITTPFDYEIACMLAKNIGGKVDTQVIVEK